MFQKIIRNSIGSDLVIYIFRCLIGFLIGYQLYLQFPKFEAYWTLLSIILVISPEAKDAKRLSVERFKSNLIGSIVGLVCFFIYEPNIYLMLTGIALTVLVCYFFQLMNVARTAMVAFVIVTIQEQAQLSSWAAVYRFISVTLGCLIGLSVTVLTSYLINYLRNKVDLPHEKL
ncbi:FUSC family protein [Chryseobacterium gotjawalense]|uniref:FUSC family protein n=1 Tax=Chryseobacterium gotjawalense TaxID=3042315 RepID=A0ABY8RFL4_9FLAO|nr:FUSC family protein [Chryseobacterium sp. wdc7]WHF52768.1 FUSC family protein [Chryseobacterium sp. wdc7]